LASPRPTRLPSCTPKPSCGTDQRRIPGKALAPHEAPGSHRNGTRASRLIAPPASSPPARAVRHIAHRTSRYQTQSEVMTGQPGNQPSLPSRTAWPPWTQPLRVIPRGVEQIRKGAGFRERSAGTSGLKLGSGSGTVPAETARATASR
jgi:hypothetical protein